MAATKRINTGDYTITTFKNDGNPLGNVAINTHTLYVDGNLVVTGIYSNVQAFDTINPILTLNANLTTAESPRAGLSGIKDNRGNQANVGLYWDEDGDYAGQWIANNGVTQGPILTSYNTKIEKLSDQPTGETGYVVITASNVGVGGSGVFVNAGVQSSELTTNISVRKYGIIFG
jgi:hypothetical protein